MSSLQCYSTFKIDVSCAAITSFTDVPSFLSLYDANKINYLLGGGSNSIFTEDFEGNILVNNIKGVSHYDTPQHHHLRVGAGENWHEFVTLCLQNKWYGMENLALIPGSVGASPIQNIGAYGCEVEKFIDSVECVLLETGEQVILKKVDCQFGYRDSIFKHDLAGKVLITHVNFTLPKAYELETSYGELAQLVEPTPEKIYHKVIEVRQSKLPDPAQLGNAGSFFKNPVIDQAQFDAISVNYASVPHFMVADDRKGQDDKVKIPAAWLIDQAGFKGKTLNGVRCHPTQPLVLTNIGGASGKDVLAMARDIVSGVRQKFGISLEAEVRLVGKTGLITL